VLAGKIFVASMLTMGVLAVCLAIVRHQPNNIGGGILTVYLIGTGWLTASPVGKDTTCRPGREPLLDSERLRPHEDRPAAAPLTLRDAATQIQSFSSILMQPDGRLPDSR
jgi:hypothetical protein